MDIYIKVNILNTKHKISQNCDSISLSNPSNLFLLLYTRDFASFASGLVVIQAGIILFS